MVKPTDEQIQWLWEQVFGKDGVEFGKTIFERKLVCYRRTRWIEADEEYDIEVIPDTDSLEFLGYLFKYIPFDCKADLHIGFHEVHWVSGQVFTECIITKDNDEIGRGFVEGKIKDVANFALFWAIYKALGGK